MAKFAALFKKNCGGNIVAFWGIKSIKTGSWARELQLLVVVRRVFSIEFDHGIKLKAWQSHSNGEIAFFFFKQYATGLIVVLRVVYIGGHD